MSNNNKLDYQTLQSMSMETLDKIHLELAQLIMPTYDLPANKKIPFWKRVYGCVTWGDARDLMDLVAKVYSDKLPQKKNYK